MVRWWEDDGWKQVENIKQGQEASLFVKRIQSLGYKDVKSWPISAREFGAGHTMYHMIHATDQLEAPQLEYRAYRDLIGNGPAGSQPVVFKHVSMLSETPNHSRDISSHSRGHARIGQSPRSEQGVFGVYVRSGHLKDRCSRCSYLTPSGDAS